VTRVTSPLATSTRKTGTVPSVSAVASSAAPSALQAAAVGRASQPAATIVPSRPALSGAAACATARSKRTSRWVSARRGRRCSRGGDQAPAVGGEAEAGVSGAADRAEVDGVAGADRHQPDPRLGDPIAGAVLVLRDRHQRAVGSEGPRRSRGWCRRRCGRPPASGRGGPSPRCRRRPPGSRPPATSGPSVGRAGRCSGARSARAWPGRRRGRAARCPGRRAGDRRAPPGGRPRRRSGSR